MSDNIKDSKKDVQNRNASNLAVFGKFPDVFSNQHHNFLARKVERLTSALYVITGFLQHDEPVRNRLRTCALDLISQSSSPSSFTSEGTEAFRAKAGEIGALLQAAHSAGLISRMNAELLRDEYGNLALFVKEHSESLRNREGTDSLQISSIGQDVVVSPTHVSDKVRNISKGHSKNSGKKGQDYRRKVLLDLMSKKDKISIKDASSAIADCSEKTIQRELLSLVRDGLAIKEGERRWSTYRRVVQSV